MELLDGYGLHIDSISLKENDSDYCATFPLVWNFLQFQRRRKGQLFSMDCPTFLLARGGAMPHYADFSLFPRFCSLVTEGRLSLVGWLMCRDLYSRAIVPFKSLAAACESCDMTSGEHALACRLTFADELLFSFSLKAANALRVPCVDRND